MFTPNPINEPMWNPATSAPLSHTVSNPEDVKKRKRTSLLSGLASKFSRKKSAPTSRISNEEIWRATSDTIHPNAAKLGMNTFNFSTGGSTDGRVIERELRRRASRDLSPCAIDGISRRRKSSDAGSASGDDDNRGRIRSGLSAYSDAARKRASGYVARLSTSSMSKMEEQPSYGEARIATFTNTHPRQINTRIDTSPAFDPNGSVSTIYSPVSSTGSSIQRSGSSIFDRSRSRFDSMATDVTTPDVSARPSKSSLPGKGAALGVLPSLWSGDELSPSVVEEEVDAEDVMPELIPLPASGEDDGASIGTKDETSPVMPDGGIHVAPGNRAQKLDAKAEMPPAPFVASDLQNHQVRVQDFTLGTHVVQNAIDMGMNAISLPRKHRKSVFVEMGDNVCEPPPAWLEEALKVEDEVSVEVEQTLHGLSISAVSGMTSRTDSMNAPSPALDTVEEEDDGLWIFGHKRSVGHILPSDVFNGKPLASHGELPLHEQAGDGPGEKMGFIPGHRRSRAVSLGRPKPISGLAGESYVEEEEEEEEEEYKTRLGRAVVEESEDSDGESSLDFFDVGDGTEVEA